MTNQPQPEPTTDVDRAWNAWTKVNRHLCNTDKRSFAAGWEAAEREQRERLREGLARLRGPACGNDRDDDPDPMASGEVMGTAGAAAESSA